MALEASQIGQRGQKPERCAVSGKDLTHDDVYFKVGSTKLGVKARIWASYDVEARQQMKADWLKELGDGNAPVFRARKPVRSETPTADQPAGE